MGLGDRGYGDLALRGRTAARGGVPRPVPAAPASLCISMTSVTEPKTLRRPAADQASAIFPLGEAGVIG